MSWLCRVKRRGDTTDLLEDGPASGTKTITNTNTIDTPVCCRCRAIWRGTTRQDTTRTTHLSIMRCGDNATFVNTYTNANTYTNTTNTNTTYTNMNTTNTNMNTTNMNTNTYTATIVIVVNVRHFVSCEH